MERRPNYEVLKAAHKAALEAEAEKTKSAPAPAPDPFEKLEAKYEALYRENDEKLKKELIRASDHQNRRQTLENAELRDFKALEKSEAESKLNRAEDERNAPPTGEISDAKSASIGHRSRFSDLSRPISEKQSDRSHDTGRERE